MTSLARELTIAVRHALSLSQPEQTGRCFWCGGKLGDEFHWDHLLPVCQGGQDLPANLVQSCPDCNLRKNGKPLGQWLAEEELPDETVLRALGHLLAHDMQAERQRRRRAHDRYDLKADEKMVQHIIQRLGGKPPPC